MMLQGGLDRERATLGEIGAPVFMAVMLLEDVISHRNQLNLYNLRDTGARLCMSVLSASVAFCPNLPRFVFRVTRTSPFKKHRQCWAPLVLLFQ